MSWIKVTRAGDVPRITNGATMKKEPQKDLKRTKNSLEVQLGGQSVTQFHLIQSRWVCAEAASAVGF